MKTQILSLQSLMDTHGVSLTDRGQVAYTAAARAVSYHLALPTAPVASPYAYFAEKYRQEVLDLLDHINEAFVIRVNEALELVKQLWVFRYNLVFDAQNPTVMANLDLLAAGGDRDIAPTYSVMLGKYGYVLAQGAALLSQAMSYQPLAPSVLAVD